MFCCFESTVVIKKFILKKKIKIQNIVNYDLFKMLLGILYSVKLYISILLIWPK